MKRLLFAVGLSVLVVGVSVWAQTAAPKRGPEHQKLSIWIGDWAYENETYATPFGPAGKGVGKVMVRPILDGFFIEWHGEEKGALGTVKWHEIDGYNASNKKFFWMCLVSDGSVQSVNYTIEGTKVEYSGTVLLGDKQCKIRGTVVFANDFLSNVEKREISADGQTWMPHFQTKGTKIKSTP